MTTRNNDVYFWLFLLVLIAVIILIILPEREPTKYVNRLSSRKETFDLIKGKSKEQTLVIIKKLAEKAKRKVPQFPDFPRLWLMPPSEKGPYGSIAERYCIEFMEMLFPGYTFDKIRPTWLKNTVHNTNRCLELDGFCEELSIAVEYNGAQHYIWPNFTNMTQEQFIRQRERDDLKAKICKERNICLLRIPYTVPLNKIPFAIYCKLLDSVPT